MCVCTGFAEKGGQVYLIEWDAGQGVGRWGPSNAILFFQRKCNHT